MISGSRRDRRQAGQTLIVFTLMMAFVVLGMLALVCDLAVVMVHYNHASMAAEVGVQSSLALASDGSTAIDPKQFYEHHQLGYNVGQLAVQCEAAIRQLQPSLSPHCTFDPGTHTLAAQVSEDVTLPVPLWGSTMHLNVTREGRTVHGQATPEG